MKKLRELKTPLVSGDKVATHEEWVDMSGAGHYDWCPVWEKRVFNKVISFKEIKNTHSFLRDNGLNIVEGKLPYNKRELESWGKFFTPTFELPFIVWKFPFYYVKPIIS